MNVHRQAKPRKEAKPIEPSEAIEVAKLCNVRMWEAFDSVRRMADDNARQRRLWRVNEAAGEIDA